MKPFNVPVGAQMLPGAPSKPMSQSAAIAELVASVDGIVEAHLPQCFVVGVMDAPAQILVVLLGSDGDANLALDQIGSGLTACLPEGSHLDVWPIQSGSAILNDVRGTDCEIYRSIARSTGQRPWWRFW
jgi:hypothetical protein